MSVFKLKKGKKVRVKIEKATKDERKVQFNVLIDKKLKNRVKQIAKICRIPLSSFMEHCIELGLNHIEQTLQDEKKRKILEEHFEMKHLLSKKTDDEEYIIRIAENNSNWLLLEGVERTIGKIRLLTRQAVEAGQAGNVKAMEWYHAELFREMVPFLNWIIELKDREKYGY